MKPILNQQIIDKYIINEFGEIPNLITKDEMIKLINNYKLTLEKVKLWALFDGDLLIKGNHGRNIIHSASLMSQMDIIVYILGKGNEINNIDVNYLSNYNQTPLIYASCNNEIEVIDFLLKKGSKINHQDKWGWTALHYACDWNQLEIIKILVEKGINIHLKGNHINKDETALDVAKHHDHQKIIDYLIPFYENINK